MVINKSINNHHSRLKSKRKQEPTDSRASMPLFFWRRLLIWIIRAVVWWLLRTRGQKSRLGVARVSPLTFSRACESEAHWPLPQPPPWDRREQGLWSAVRRKEKRENLSLGGCHHRLARSQVYSLNLHWYNMKSVVRKWEMGHREVGGRAAKTDSLCARLQAHASAPSASHKHPSSHLLTSAPVALPL